MPSAVSSCEEHPALLKTLESVCNRDLSTAVGSGTLAGYEVLFAHHPYPAFLQGNVDATADKLDTIVLIQPYSEAAKYRSLSASHERKQSSNVVISSTGCNSSCSSDLNVTGSPLRKHFGLVEGSFASPFVITMAEAEQRTGPVVTIIRSKSFDVTAARVVWSSLSVLVKASSIRDSLLPIFIVVDGQNSKGTLLFGLDPRRNASSGSSSRCHVYNKGPLKLHQLPQIDTLRSCCTGPATAAYVESHATATYELITAAVEHSQQENKEKQQNPSKDDQVMHESGSNVLTIKCSWPRPTAVLSRPAPDAQTQLSISIQSGDCRGLLSRELRLLTRLVVGLRTQEVMWYAPEEGRHATHDKLNELFQQHQLSRAERVKSRVVRGSYMFDEVISGALNRQHIDFVDSLWVILSECSSLDDLEQGLQYLFYAVAMNNVRPQIHVRNTTQVGVICRGVMRGQMQMPDLSGVKPLLMLIELGVSKVHRDYTTILQAGELATGEQLSPFMIPTTTTTAAMDEKQLTTTNHEESVLRLHQLQLTVHVIACLHEHLRLPPTTLATYTVQILQQLSQQSGDVVGKAHDFSFPLQTSSIKEVLDTESPSCWQVNLTSIDKKNNNSSSGGTISSKSVKKSSSSGSGGGYRSDLQLTVTHLPILRVLELEDEFGDLFLLDNVRSEVARLKHYCTFVSTVTDSMMC